MHTADIGIESWGESIEECFEQAAYGLAEILGAKAGGGWGRASAHVSASGADRGALLVDFLNELLLLHETDEVAFGRVAITHITDTALEADVGVEPIEGETETTGVRPRPTIGSRSARRRVSFERGYTSTCEPRGDRSV